MFGSIFKSRGPRRSAFRHLLLWIRNLALLLVVAGAAARFYTEYQLDRKLDELSGMVAPVGTLTFGKSYTAFNGDIGVESISFIPDPGLDAPPATLKQVVLHTPGYHWVLGFRGGEVFPRSMGLTLNGLNVELIGVTGQSEERSAVSGIPLETLGCGDISQFETIDLQKMGFAPLNTSLTGRYRVLPPDRIELQAVVQTSDATETHVDLELGVSNLMDFARGRGAPAAELVALNVALHAAEFNRRRNAYCAEQAQTSTEEFISSHLAAAQETLLTNGYTVSIGLLDQYRRFASGEGVWTFIGRPDRPVELMELFQVKPIALLDRLNVNAAIGSALPEPVLITKVMMEEDEAGDMVIVEPEVTAEGRPVVRTSGPKSFGWILVPTAQAASYIGTDVRIDTLFGKRYAGALTAVTDGQAVVQTRLPGGQARIPIPLSQIKEIRVMQYESP